jgi:hypothetical protein
VVSEQTGGSNGAVRRPRRPRSSSASDAPSGIDGAPSSPPTWASRLLSATLIAASALFVGLTLGTSLLGVTSFYAGGLLVNELPWIAEQYEPTTVTNNYAGDTVDFFIPGRREFVDRTLSGDFPGWSSLQGGGSALGSVPTYGLLAPTGLAWWLLPPSLAPAWEKLTILVVAAAGTALFLRQLQLGRHAAWLGGMVYAASGFMMAWTNWPQAGVAAMLPWLLWSTERALRIGSWRAHAPVALAVAALLLGGFPAVAGQGFYAAGGYVLVRLLSRSTPWREAGLDWHCVARSAAKLVTALATGLFLAGGQLAAFVYMFLELDTSYREASFHRVLPLRMALTALFPNGWGTHGGTGFFSETNPIEANAYLGAAGVVLAVVALLVPVHNPVVRSARWYFAAVGIVGLGLIYVQGPLLQWVGSLPIFAGNPIGRLISVVLLAGAILAGIGFDAALRGPRTSASVTRRLLAGLIVTIAGTVALAAFLFAENMEQSGEAPKRIIAVAVAGVVVTSIAVGVARLQTCWSAMAMAVVPVVVALQGAMAAIPMWAQVDREDFYPTTTAHDMLRDRIGSDRMAVAGSAMVNGTPAFYGLRSATGHVFVPPSFADLQRRIAPQGKLSATYWVLPADGGLPVLQSPGLDRLGVRYVTIGHEAAIPGRVEQVSSGSDEVVLPTEGQPALEVPLPEGPLRGVIVDPLSGLSGETDGFLLVTVRDAVGRVVAQSRRYVDLPRPAVPLPVPLDGEALESEGGPYTVQLRWTGPTPPPTIRADESGRPGLSVVRPQPDGLALAYAGEVVVWERLTALPRIRWASRARVVEDDAARADLVAGTTLPSETVVLGKAVSSMSGGTARLTVLEDSGDTIRVRVRADAAGYLVVADSIQTGWTATVDGATARLLPADHAFGAVLVPEGMHEVTLRYTPRGATAGLIAAGTGTVLLALMALAPKRRHNRRAAVDVTDGSANGHPLP